MSVAWQACWPQDFATAHAHTHATCSCSSACMSVCVCQGLVRDFGGHQKGNPHSQAA